MAGLILEGGGMRAGFVAGALMALMDKGFVDFDVALAVSASIPTLAYFVAGQREEMERVWRDELNTPNLVCYRNIPAASLALSTKRPVLNIDYLVYEVFKKKYPLDIQALLRSRTTCLFALTKTPEASLTLLSPGHNDIYRTFKAGLAVPGCYPGTVRLGRHEYVDGGTVNPLPVTSLLDKKMNKVIAVLTKPLDCESEPPNFLERAFIWRYLHRYDWLWEKLWEAAHAYNEQVLLLERLAQERPPRAFIICPENTLPARFITRDRRKINRTIDLGYRKVESLENEIRNFLREREGHFK
jgi:predicted patatin/cPLA2 family phospholipase